MLSGILHPDGGKISVNGYIPYKQRKEYVARIGVVFGQNSQLQWDLPPIDTFELLRYNYKIPKQQYEERLSRYTEMLDMGSFLEQPVRQLSPRQRMRADIVAALLHAPRIVFFDEPTIDVDVMGKETIRNFIQELNQREGITMIFTTHDMQDIEKTCQKLIIIDEGKKIYDGSLYSIREKFATMRQIDMEFAWVTEIEPIPHVFIKQMDELDGITFAMVMTNFILYIGLGSAFYLDEGYLPYRINNGNIGTELLKPISFRGILLASDLGNICFCLLFEIVSAIIVAVLSVGMNKPNSLTINFFVNGLDVFSTIFYYFFCIFFIIFCVSDQTGIIQVSHGIIYFPASISILSPAYTRS